MVCQKCNEKKLPDAAFCIKNGASIKTRKKRIRPLIVMVAILFIFPLGTCAVIAPISFYNNIQENRKIQKARYQIELLSNALYRHYFDTAKNTYDGRISGSFPSSLQGLIENIDQTEGWNGPYIEPEDLTLDPWGFEYQYIMPGEHGNHYFDLYSFGADGQEGGDYHYADICSWEINN